jgi:hypothetical protein
MGEGEGGDGAREDEHHDDRDDSESDHDVYLDFSVDVGKGLPWRVSEGAIWLASNDLALRCSIGTSFGAAAVITQSPVKWPTNQRARVGQTRSRRSPELRAKDE